jgi:uncharacterized membrane protein YqjE
MEVVQRLRTTAKIIIERLELHGKLIGVEWAEEKQRLAQLLVILLLGMSCMFCLILFVGVLTVALGWATEYRIITIAIMLSLYAACLALCAYRFRVLVLRGAHAFVAAREEIGADLALIRSQL